LLVSERCTHNDTFDSYSVHRIFLSDAQIAC